MLTEATLEALLEKVAWLVTSREVLSEKWAVATSCRVSPRGRETLAGSRVRRVTVGAVTRTVVCAERPEKEAVMAELPVARPFTRPRVVPVVVTLATLGEAERNVAMLVTS